MWARKGSREPPVGNLWNLRMGLRTKSVKLGAACHRFRKGEGVAGQKKKRKGITVPVPARIVRRTGLSARTS
jgi:hypothetical protein